MPTPRHARPVAGLARLVRRVIERIHQVAASGATRVPGLSGVILMAQNHPALFRIGGAVIVLVTAAAAVLVGGSVSSPPKATTAEPPRVTAQSSATALPTPVPFGSPSLAASSPSPVLTTPGPSPSHVRPGTSSPTIAPTVIAPTVTSQITPHPTSGQTQQPTHVPPACVPVWRNDSVPASSAPGGTLAAVASAAHDDVWAVGTTGNGTSGPDASHGLAEHWNGRTWSAIATPRPDSRSKLLGVTAPSRTLAWAVGVSVLDGHYQTLILRWDGTRWTRTSSPNPGTRINYLVSVWAPNPQEAWAVGYTSTGSGPLKGLVLHWNGTDWVPVHIPDTTERALLLGIHGSGPSDVWAVGRLGNRTLSEHWNGTTWSIVASPGDPGTTMNLTGVWARSSTDVWAAGGYVDGAGQSHPLAAHFNGTAWSTNVPPDPGDSSVFSVVAPADRDVWLFGVRGNTGEATGSQLIQHWNGSSWSTLTSPSTPGGFLRGATARAGEIWAVGWRTDPNSTHAPLSNSHRC
ncbi:MAG: hypothetical protein JWN52_3002 [Actinomycetia bacterium]|nr:hypothetical protein [Actinomycetes bacterium]